MKAQKTITHKDYLQIQASIISGVAARVKASDIDVKFIKDAADRLLKENDTVVVADNEKKDQPTFVVNF